MVSISFQMEILFVLLLLLSQIIPNKPKEEEEFNFNVSYSFKANLNKIRVHSLVLSR